MMLIIVLTVFYHLTNGNIIVQTKSGKVAGKEVPSIIQGEKYYSFLGIPYALPPVEDLRFKPPVPHPGWGEILDAKKEKPHCAQYNLPVRQIREYGFCGNENCLHVSIHTPRLPNGQDLNLPTIVFFHNEHFKVSHNGSKDYGPDFIVKEDVILATINHRLGSLGFMSLEDIYLPGNNGLRDAILGLQWIKDNIKSFGGDPNKVTLMGSIGGGALVDLLLHSQKAKGLFSSVILQSGTSWQPMYLDETPKKSAVNLVEYLDETATTSSYILQRMKEIPADTLTESESLSTDTDKPRAIQRAVIPFGPIVEHEHPDAVITSKPEDSNAKLDVPIMIGYNSREAIEMSERYLYKPQYLTFADRDFLFLFPRRVNYHFKINDQVYYHIIDEIKEFYFEDAYVKISKPGEFITYLSDIMVFYPIDYTVRSYLNISSSLIYYYTFDYSGDFNMRKKNILEEALNIDGTWGASITDELCYLFICNPIKKVYEKALKDKNSEEIKVLKNMVRMWTNFAKFENPTPPESDFTWTPATKQNKDCLVINEEPRMVTNLHQDRVQFWDDFIAKYEKMAVDGVVKDIRDEL